MKNKQANKEAMIATLDAMIDNSDKGPSGFWVDDYEGCGNPVFFPEFQERLKRGRLVQKEHYLCPWNTAVMYGNGHGNVQTGCYYSCSIEKAKYLSGKELKDVLVRFKRNLQNGRYDNLSELSPLLTNDEAKRIENRIHMEQELERQKEEIAYKEQQKKAASLIAKYPDEKDLICANYGKRILVNTYKGVLDFDPDGFKSVVGADKFSYNEYLDVQFRSLGRYRSYFADCYFNIPMGFMGQIERITATSLCFKRIFVRGMCPDGEVFDGKEDHVWMDKTGLEQFGVGDCLSFEAEVYRYVKTGNGKMIDFGLRNPSPLSVKKIESYDLPSDKELMRQEINLVICKTCFLSEQCNRTYCIMEPKQERKRQNDMLDMVNGSVD